MKRIDKTCPECSKPFVTRHDRQICCSISCGQKYVQRLKPDSLIGRRFGRLEIIATSPKRDPTTGHRFYICRCQCGKEFEAVGVQVKRGHTQSCGCLRLDALREAIVTHGELAFKRRPSSEYAIWQGIKNRCYRSTAVAFKYYGARGITMCERWQHSFAAFLADMGRRPTKAHSIDRINNNGHYEPSNCRWATPHEQRINSRPKTKKTRSVYT